MSSTSGYDRHITIFSPEGRLYQVEYAFKAINNEGYNSLGVVGKGCAVLITQRKIPDALYEAKSITRLFTITPTIGSVCTGLVADSRALIARARQEAAEYEYKYGCPIGIELLARRLANLNQISTQQASMRPFGVAISLISIDLEDDGSKQPRLFKCDPSGYYIGYSACASGPKSSDLQNSLEKKLIPSSNSQVKLGHFGETLNDCIECAITTLSTCLGQEFTNNDIEIGVVEDGVDGGRFRCLTIEEIDAHLTALAEKD